MRKAWSGWLGLVGLVGLAGAKRSSAICMRDRASRDNDNNTLKSLLNRAKKGLGGRAEESLPGEGSKRRKSSARKLMRPFFLHPFSHFYDIGVCWPVKLVLLRCLSDFKGQHSLFVGEFNTFYGNFMMEEEVLFASATSCEIKARARRETP